jgi:hypothetical protein
VTPGDHTEADIEAEKETVQMADQLVLYTNPQSRGRIARWMLEESASLTRPKCSTLPPA